MDFLPYKMAVDFNMFDAFMKDRVCSDMKCYLVVIE